jgi:hypothetical protein
MPTPIITPITLPNYCGLGKVLALKIKNYPILIGNLHITEIYRYIELMNNSEKYAYAIIGDGIISMIMRVALFEKIQKSKVVVVEKENCLMCMAVAEIQEFCTRVLLLFRLIKGKIL